MSRTITKTITIGLILLASYVANAAPVMKCKGKEVTGGEANRMGEADPNMICEKITKVSYDRVSGKYKPVK